MDLETKSSHLYLIGEDSYKLSFINLHVVVKVISFHNFEQ